MRVNTDAATSSRILNLSLRARGMLLTLQALEHTSIQSYISTDTFGWNLSISEETCINLLTELEENGFIVRNGRVFSCNDLRIGPRPAIDGVEPGWIYAIRRNHDGAIKLGKSVDPNKRIVHIRASGAATRGGCTLLACSRVGDMSTEEIRIQRFFHDSRLDGEWFAVDWGKARAYLVNIGEPFRDIAQFATEETVA